MPLPAPTSDADLRWNQWTEKGRRDDAAFKEKSRAILAVAGTAVAIAAGVLWIITAV